MALRAFAALAEESVSLSSSTHISQPQSPVTSAREDPLPASGLHRYHTHVVYVKTSRQTHIHGTEFSKNFFKVCFFGKKGYYLTMTCLCTCLVLLYILTKVVFCLFVCLFHQVQKVTGNNKK